MGLAALVNDLHKGRDTGGVWRAAIDVSAALLVFISLTGLVLLYFVHKYRVACAILVGAGALASYIVYAVGAVAVRASTRGRALLSAAGVTRRSALTEGLRA